MPLGILREIAATHFLLAVEIERGVIRGHRAHQSRPQGVPEHVLVAFVAQRRRHDVLRPFELGLLGIGLVEDEIRNHRLDPHPHAAVLGRLSFAQGILARGVHHIDMRAGKSGEGGQMMYALRLDHRRPRRLVPLGSGFAGGEQLPLQAEKSPFRSRNGP